MVKKIFVIIGIVFGAVAAFTGSVFGVMALMGKFETPVVYPDQVYFADDTGKRLDEHMIVEDDQIFSFNIVGTTSNTEYGVNHDDCYLWFENNTGFDLIELCDENGTPLTMEKTNRRYVIKCNQKIYYRLKNLNQENELLKDQAKRGKVVLAVRDVYDINPATYVTLFIDREIKSVVVNDKTSNVANSEQNIYLGIADLMDGKFLYFDYIVNPEVAHFPFDNNQGAKKIELYCVSTPEGSATDYVAINNNTITSNLLKDVVGYDSTNGKYYFKGTQIGDYKFIVSAFKTYKDYYTPSENESNYARLTNNTSKMVQTTVRIHVLNSDAEKLEFKTDGVALDLYSNNNYITLNSSISVEDKFQSKNMQMSIEPNAIETIRYKSIEFGKLQEALNKAIEENIAADISDEAGNSLEIEALYSGFYTIKTSNSLKYEVGSKSLEFVDEIKKNDDNTIYTCKNGILVKYNNQYYFLPSGSYLDVYQYNSDNESYTLYNKDNTDFTFTTKYINGTTGADKTWQFVCETLPTNDYSIGALLINTDGTYLFDSIDINVQTTDVRKDIILTEKQLDITYSETGMGYQSLDFSNFVQINNMDTVTYNSFVLVAEQTDSNVGYSVETAGVNINGYAVVGKFDDNGNFVNKVTPIINDKYNIDKPLTLYLMQLKNKYNQNLTQTLKSENIEVAKVFVSEPITIKSQPILNTELLVNELDKDNESDEDVVFYEQSTGHTLTISASNNDMLQHVYNYYDLKNNYKTYFKAKVGTDLVNNIEFTDINLTQNNEMVLTFQVGQKLLNSEAKVGIWVEGLSKVNAKLAEVQIKSSAPGAIVLKGENNKSIELKSDENSVDTITFVVGYNGTGFTFTNTDYPYDKLFNKNISENEKGFQDGADKWKGVAHPVTYAFNPSNIIELTDEGGNYYTPNFITDGETTLAVTIAGVTRYIEINVDASSIVWTQTKNTTNEPSITLAEVVTLNAGGTPIAEEHLTLSNFNYTSYGNGTLTVDKVSDTCYEYKDNETIVLQVVCNNKKWQFNRTANQYTPLTIEFDITAPFCSGENTRTQVIAFTSDLTVEYNSAWPTLDGKNVLYQGTQMTLFGNDNALIVSSGVTINKVDVYKKGKLSDDEFDENTSGNIYTLSGTTYTLAASTDYDANTTYYVKQDVTSGVCTFTELGEYQVAAYNGAVLLCRANLTVMPNVKITQKEDYTKEFKYGETISASNMFTAESYDLEPTYGTTEKASYGGGTVVSTGFSFKIDGNIVSTVKIPTEIGTTLTTNLEVVYGGVVVYTFKNIKFVNDKTVTISGVENNILYTEKSYTVTLDGLDVDISSISGSDLLSVGNDSKSIVVASSVTGAENVEITITFSNGMTYTQIFTIKPYVPDYTHGKEYKSETKISIDALISDLFKETVDTIEFNTIKFKGYVYDSEVGGNAIGFTDNKISIVGPTQDVWFEFTVTKNKNGTPYTYTFRAKVTITNTDTLTIDYPYENTNKVTIDGAYTFINDEEKAYLQGKEFEYEPLLIFSEGSNKTVTIDLLQDEEFNIAPVSTNGKIKEVKRVAYQMAAGIDPYVRNEKIDINGSTITFKPSATNISGYVVFKITTTNGNFGYYVVRLNRDVNTIENALKNCDQLWQTDKFETGATIESVANDNLFAERFGRAYNAANYSFYLIRANELQDVVIDELQYVGRMEILSGLKGKVLDENFSLSGNSFRTIELGVVYSKDSLHYIAGRIILDIQPTGKPTGATGVENAINGYSNGEYKIDLGSAPKSWDELFGENFTIASISNNNIASGTGTTLTISGYVTETTVFDVYYSYGTVVVKLTCTYNPIVVEESYSVTLGGFNNGFNKTYNLKALSAYKGAFTIDGTAEGFSITDGETLTYINDLGTAEQNVQVKVVLTDCGSKKVDLNVKLLPGYHIVQDATKPGLNEGNRLNTTKAAIDDYYKQVVGSTLSVKEVNKSGYYTYTFGESGLTIYTENNSILTISYANDSFTDQKGANRVVSYIVKDTDKDKASGSLTFEDGGTINFTHLLNQKNLDLTIKVGNYCTQTLFVTAVSTYYDIVPVYLNGANHENVTSKQEIPNLYTDLFGEKVALYSAKDTKAEGVDFDEMGFNDPNNPNYIEFTLNKGSAATFTENGIKFADVDDNTSFDMYLTSRTLGARKIGYKYQVMASDTLKEGLDTSNVVDGHVGNDSENLYISFQKGKFDTFSKTVVLGRLVDSLNFGENSAFVLKSVEVTTTAPSTYTPTKVSPAVEGYISYTFTDKDITYIVSYNTQTREITLKVDGDISDNITLKLNILCATDYLLGEDKPLIVDIVKYNITAPTSVADIYAEDKFDLLDKLSLDEANKTAYKSDTNLTFEYLESESTYQKVGEKAKSLTGTYYVDFDDEKEMIVTHTVGEDVLISMKFNMLHNNKIFGTVTYTFNLKLNLQLTVNGQPMVVDNNPQFYTKLYLTTKQEKDGTANSPLQIKFKEKFEKQFEETVEGVTTKYNYFTDNFGDTAYEELVFNLYRRKTVKDISSINMSYDGVDIIEQGDLVARGIITIDSQNKTLTFLKDYTGTINLKLAYDTEGNGVYYVNWTIDVVGLVKTVERANTQVLPVGGEAKLSGDKVNLITAINNDGFSINTDVGLGIDIYDGNTNKDVTNKIQPTVIVKYVVIQQDSSKTLQAKEMFAKAVSVDATLTSESLDVNKVMTFTNNLSISVTLPSVDITWNGAWVIYKISLDYYGFSRDFYATYNVRNEQKVSEKKTNINVDTDLMKLSATDEFATYLDLFYFKEEYVFGEGDSKKTFTLSLNKDKKIILKIILNDGTKEYTYDSTKGIFANSESADVYQLTDKEFVYNTSWNKNENKPNDDNVVTNFTIDRSEGKYTVNKYYSTVSDATEKVYGVFESRHENIFEFKQFIDTVATIKLTNAPSDKQEFTLQYMNDGRFGVNLDLEGDDVLVKNDLSTELVVQDANKNTISSIKEFDGSNGFRLFSDKTITANSSLMLSDIFLSTYFTEGSDHANKEIIGVFGAGDAPDDNWTTNGKYDSDTGLGTKLETISVPNGDGTNVNVYELYQVTYTGAAGNTAICSISKPLYALKSLNTGANIYVVNYQQNSGQEAYIVKYLGEKEQVLNLNNAVLCYTMKDGKLTLKDDVSIADLTPGETDEWTYANKQIKMANSDLIAYKNINPTERYYNDIKTQLTIDTNYELKMVVKFVLPSSTIVVDDYVADNTVFYSTDLELKMTQSNWDKYVTKVEEVIETGGTSYLTITGTTIQYNKDAIKEYFNDEANKDETELKVKVNVTTNAGIESVTGHTITISKDTYSTKEFSITDLGQYLSVSYNNRVLMTDGNWDKYVTIVEEVETSYLTITGDKTISYNTTNIGTYFTNNTSVTELKVKVKVTTKDDNAVERVTEHTITISKDAYLTKEFSITDLGDYIYLGNFENLFEIKIGTDESEITAEVCQENIQDIEEVGTYYSTVEKDDFGNPNGVITLNKDLINEYFENNVNAKTLTIKYSMTIVVNDVESTHEFVLLVNKPQA